MFSFFTTTFKDCAGFVITMSGWVIKWVAGNKLDGLYLRNCDKVHIYGLYEVHTLGKLVGGAGVQHHGVTLI